MKKLLSILGCLYLSGCSTVPIDEYSGLKVPKDRIYLNSAFQSKPNQAEIIILRDNGFTGGACSHEIYLNDNKVMALRAGEFGKIYVDEGEHILKLTMGYGLCPNIVETNVINAKPNSKFKYRITTSSNMVLRFVRIE